MKGNISVNILNRLQMGFSQWVLRMREWARQSEEEMRLGARTGGRMDECMHVCGAAIVLYTNKACKLPHRTVEEDSV